jgi:hypothetical protein
VAEVALMGFLVFMAFLWLFFVALFVIAGLAIAKDIDKLPDNIRSGNTPIQRILKDPTTFTKKR